MHHSRQQIDALLNFYLDITRLTTLPFDAPGVTQKITGYVQFLSNIRKLRKVEKLESSKSIPERKTVMADDDVDHDLLDFMRLHINGNGHCEVKQTTGVLESAEQIYDVSPQPSPAKAKLIVRIPSTCQ